MKSENKRYIKIEPEVPAPEGQITGTINIVHVLLTHKCPEMKSYHNQLKLFQFLNKVKDSKPPYLVLSEEDWAWTKNMLEKCDYTGFNVGLILSSWDNPPNVAPEDYKV